MNLLSLLAGTMLSQSSVNSVSGKTGLSSKANPEACGALSQHKNNNSMDLQLKDADEDDGAKIIHHILGKKEDKVTQDLSAQTGLGTDQIHQVLSIMAPGLMSGVSNAAEAYAAEAAQAANTQKPMSPLLPAHRRRNLRFPPGR